MATLSASSSDSLPVAREHPPREGQLSEAMRQIAENMLSAQAQVPLADIRRRRAEPTAHESDALDSATRDLDTCDIVVLEQNLDAEAIAASCARSAAGGVRGFIIDYAQNVAPSHPEQQERDRIAAMMRAAQPRPASTTPASSSSASRP